VLYRIETRRPEYVFIRNCMVQPLEGEQMFATDMQVSTLEGQLLSDIEAVAFFR
jgi:hypothetical protein